MRSANLTLLTISAHLLEAVFPSPRTCIYFGTMNSADRSIAIVDVAIRRRFAFVKLWPQMKVVAEHGGPLMHLAFKELIEIFVDHASDDAFTGLPGIPISWKRTRLRQGAKSLRVNLAPLLQEYLSQGYVATFSDAIRAYLQWLETLE